MRLKDLFSVPTGQKVTERHLRRVLISSICSILLCMSCLVSTTWAWFTVSIENTGNVIWIGPPKIILKVNGQDFTSGDKLLEKSNTVEIIHDNADDLDKKSTLYVTLTIKHGDETTAGYITLSEENKYRSEIRIPGGSEYVLCWEVSWFVPPSIDPLNGDTLTLTPGESTEPSSDPATDSTVETSANEGEDPSAEPSTETPTETPIENPTEPPSETPEETSAEETIDPSEGDGTNPDDDSSPDGAANDTIEATIEPSGESTEPTGEPTGTETT